MTLSQSCNQSLTLSPTLVALARAVTLFILRPARHPAARADRERARPTGSCGARSGCCWAWRRPALCGTPCARCATTS